MRYRVRAAGVGPSSIAVNGVRVPLATRDTNPYRVGGWRVPAYELAARLDREQNIVEIEL